MSSGTKKTSDQHSVEAALNILRRLLDEESIIHAQLTYVVTHIHAPLLEGCDPVNTTGKRVKPTENNEDNIRPRAILTFPQYWELFANIATLHKAQSILVGKIESAITQSVSLLGQQQRERQEEERDRAGKVSTQGSALSDSLKDVDVLQIIPEIFCSATMRHYMAEHMMYSLHYTRNIAPRVLQLWRLWRGRLDKHLGVEERQEVMKYVRFLHFLWEVMGRECGVPDDPRVVCARLPETIPTPAISLAPSNICESNRSNSHSGNTRYIYCSGGKSSLASQASMHEPPPIPYNWRGFETLLVLLATPLSSLRRYTHVARCLVESRFLRRSMRVHLQREFVDIVAQRIAEEGSIILDELAKQDVDHIIALIDESTVTPTTTTQVPYSSSTGPASLSSTLNSTMGTMTGLTGIAAAAPLYEPGGKKCPRIPPDLDGSRVLVHYGHLTKRFRRGRHERLMFLFSDWLCYVDELANGRMRLCASIALETLKVVELDDTVDTVNAFDIVTNESRLTFFAPTPEQKHQWVDALRNTAMAHVKKTKKWTDDVGRATITTTTKGGGVVVWQQQQQQQSGDVGRLIRATAPPLPHNSRLQRQRRVDQVRQERLLMRHLPAESDTTIVVATTPTSATAMTTETILKTTCKEPSTASVTFDYPERRRRSFSWRSPHGNFDVTHWAQHSADTDHRRVRSTDFFLHSLSPKSPHGRSMGDGELHHYSFPSAHPSAHPPPLHDVLAPANDAGVGDDTCDPHQHATAAVVAGLEMPWKPPRTPVMRLMSERFQESSSFNSAERNSHASPVKAFSLGGGGGEYGGGETTVLLRSLPLSREKCSSPKKNEASDDLSYSGTGATLALEGELGGGGGPARASTAEEGEGEESVSNDTFTYGNNKNSNDSSFNSESSGVHCAPTQEKETEK